MAEDCPAGESWFILVTSVSKSVLEEHKLCFNLFKYSYNHRMAWFGRDLGRSFSPPPGHGRWHQIKMFVSVLMFSRSK